MAVQLQIDTCSREELKGYAEKVKSLPPTTRDADKLVLYGLCKHATERDVNTGRLGFFSRTERAKWDAWKAFEKKSEDEEMREYTNKVKQQHKQTSTK